MLQVAPRLSHQGPSKRPWLKWYASVRWARLRAAQLRRVPCCERCTARGRRAVTATVAHHKIKHNGDYKLFWEGDLASSCKPCHDRWEQQIELNGYSNEMGADGFPLDPNHPFNRGET